MEFAVPRHGMLYSTNKIEKQGELIFNSLYFFDFFKILYYNHACAPARYFNNVGSRFAARINKKEFEIFLEF